MTGGGWLQVSVVLPAARCEHAEAVLEDLGADAITLRDAADQPILEPDPGATPLWQLVQVQALFDAGREAGALTRALREALGADTAVGAEWLADQAWERAWLAHFRPMRFGRRLWIRPSGFEVPAEAEAVLDLDPGLAFGTGTHPTTALCLEWLDAQPPRGLAVLDYGCGSGILGIAALALGASRVDAVDIDPQALEASRANATRNRVAERVRTLMPAELGNERYDLVLANILAGPLVELAPTLCARLAPNGAVVLSGLLREQAESVREAYRPWIELDQLGEQEGWIRLCGRGAAAVAP